MERILFAFTPASAGGNIMSSVVLITTVTTPLVMAIISFVSLATVVTWSGLNGSGTWKNGITTKSSRSTDNLLCGEGRRRLGRSSRCNDGVRTKSSSGWGDLRIGHRCLMLIYIFGWTNFEVDIHLIYSSDFGLLLHRRERMVIESWCLTRRLNVVTIALSCGTRAVFIVIGILAVLRNLEFGRLLRPVILSTPIDIWSAPAVDKRRRRINRGRSSRVSLILQRSMIRVFGR
jgi:hypothetical protein